jgi:hypothetical protein
MPINDLAMWIYVLPEEVVQNKLCNLTQRWSVEALSQITNLKLSMGEIDRFVHTLKLEIPKRVVVNPFNEGGHHNDSKQMLIYAVAMDATVKQPWPKEKT